MCYETLTHCRDSLKWYIQDKLDLLERLSIFPFGINSIWHSTSLSLWPKQRSHLNSHWQSQESCIWKVSYNKKREKHKETWTLEIQSLVLTVAVQDILLDTEQAISCSVGLLSFTQGDILIFKDSKLADERIKSLLKGKSHFNKHKTFCPQHSSCIFRREDLI